MRDVIDRPRRWWDAGGPSALGTVVGTWKSAPRQPGASMLVGPDGTAVGSVSGGCVEGAVYELGERGPRRPATPVLQRYGVSDDDAFSVGLTCGGIIDLFVEPVVAAVVPGARRDRRRRRGRRAGRGRHAHRGDDARVGAPAGRPGRQRRAAPSARRGSTTPCATTSAACSRRAAPASSGTARDGERRLDDIAVFVASYAPPPRMIVFGAIDFAAAVARVGSFLGYRVTVCDARPTFATARASPTPTRSSSSGRTATSPSTEIDARTVLCVLTHDPKFDVPLLEVALRMDVAYVGAMGSRRTATTARAAARTRAHRRRTGPAARADRPGHRRPHARRRPPSPSPPRSSPLRWGGSGQPLRRTRRPDPPRDRRSCGSVHKLNS